MFHEMLSCNLSFLENLDGSFPQCSPQLHNTSTATAGIQGVQSSYVSSNHLSYPPSCGKSICYPQVFRFKIPMLFGVFELKLVILNSYPLFHIPINHNNILFILSIRIWKKKTQDSMTIEYVKHEGIVGQHKKTSAILVSNQDNLTIFTLWHNR